MSIEFKDAVRIDLIYEGIATPLPLIFPLFLFLFLSELTWFTKGLRLPYQLDQSKVKVYVRIDLIYEGIATEVLSFVWTFCCLSSELTWFTKGLRLNYLTN